MTPLTQPGAGQPPWPRALAAEPPRRSAWLWCLVCERAYPRETGRQGVQPCPYEDCKDRAGFYTWDWNRTRKLHPEYPEAPRPGVHYPLIGA